MTFGLVKAFNILLRRWLVFWKLFPAQPNTCKECGRCASNSQVLHELLAERSQVNAGCQTHKGADDGMVVTLQNAG